MGDVCCTAGCSCAVQECVQPGVTGRQAGWLAGWLSVCGPVGSNPETGTGHTLNVFDLTLNVSDTLSLSYSIGHSPR
jgi:hypothetical protein